VGQGDPSGQHQGGVIGAANALWQAGPSCEGGRMGLDQGEMSAPCQKRRSSRPLVAPGLPRLADDFGARPWARTVLLTGFRSAGVTVQHEAAGRAKSRRGPKRKNVGQKPRANVSVGSLAEAEKNPALVRSSAESGHSPPRQLRPLWPITDSCAAASCICDCRRHALPAHCISA
jgi:hypothetical protein